MDSKLTVNISPIRGHGSDAYQELYADAILVNVNMDSYVISNDLPVNEITFCKAGLIRRLVREDDPATVFNEGSFNNTFTAAVSTSFGTFGVGDRLNLPALLESNLSARVVYANTTHVTGVYESQLQRFVPGNTIVSDSGVSAVITDIVQPEVKLLTADVVSITNCDTILRDDNSSETLQLLIKIK